MSSELPHSSTVESYEPPRKRAAAEGATTAARARFLRELEQYASDDEDEVAAVARSRGVVSSSHPNLSTSTHLPHQGAVAGLQPSFTSTTSRAPAVDSSEADFVFESSPAGVGGSRGGQAEDGDDDDDDFISSTPATHRNTSVAAATGGVSSPARVGLSLLHRMHAESVMSSGRESEAHSGPDGKKKKNVGGGGPAFEVVHTYVPLSTGGFLSTAGAGADLMEGREVRVGDILSLRKLPSTAPAPSNDFAHAFGPQSRGAVGSFAATGSNPASPNVKGTQPSPPPPPGQPSATSVSSPSSPLPPQLTSLRAAAITADSAQQALRHFKPAASTNTTAGATASSSDTDKDYGRRLNPEMVKMLCEVTRADMRGRTVEVLFLDGTRLKLPFRDLRPAGYDEQRRYAQWKADPASRPVATMHSGASSPTSTHPASPVAQTACTRDQHLAALTAPSVAKDNASSRDSTAATWWVIPRLLVRVSTEAAGDWYGKKCVVKAIRRSENAIRLTEWKEDAPGTPSATAETRELIGVDGLETVVPKKGGRAMIVLGPRRGEMCTVRSRVRGPEGDLTGVEVEVSRTKEVVTLTAEELCALAR